MRMVGAFETNSWSLFNIAFVRQTYFRGDSVVVAAHPVGQDPSLFLNLCNPRNLRINDPRNPIQSAQSTQSSTGNESSG